jgi:hypothetical protein
LACRMLQNWPTHVKQWAFGHKNINVARYEDFRIDCTKCLGQVIEWLTGKTLNRGVLDFLDLPYDGQTEFRAYNQYRECKNPRLDEFRVRLTRLRKKNPVFNKLHGAITSMLPTQGLGIQKLLLSINYKRAQRKGLDEDFRKELVSEFCDDICLLEQLTGRDLGTWKK